jgi:hypothetical protein
MAILRTYKSIEKDLYVLLFVNDAESLGEDDKKRMRKFGEPEIELGGTFIGGATAASTIGSGAVTAITILDGGNNYPSTPTVVISGGGGSGATATATLTNGVVTSITVTGGGTSYTSAPTVTITSPANQFTLPSEKVKIRSGFPVRREFDSTASPFDTNTLTKVNAYKDEIQARFVAAITALRAETDSFTGEEVDTV